MQYSIAFCSRQEAASDVIFDRFARLIDPDNAKNVLQKFNTNRRQHSRQFSLDNFRPEIASKVISGVAVDLVGMGASMKFGDSMLNSDSII